MRQRLLPSTASLGGPVGPGQVGGASLEVPLWPLRPELCCSLGPSLSLPTCKMDIDGLRGAGGVPCGGRKQEEPSHWGSWQTLAMLQAPNVPCSAPLLTPASRAAPTPGDGPSLYFPGGGGTVS